MRKRTNNVNKPTPIRRRRWLRWLKALTFAFAVLLAAAWIGIRSIPLPPALLAKPPESLELTDRHGRTLRETTIGDRFRREVARAEIPQNVIHAMLAAEDKRFFSHGGVDWLAFARATVTSARAGRAVSGASTISQQLIKLTVPRERTVWTKVIEMATAKRLEQSWSKDEILAEYLNRLDFGNLNYGILAAANYYFGKPLADLSDAEAALLAGLPWNPSRINPRTHPQGAKARQETILRRMRDNGWLTAGEHERAVAEPLCYVKRGREFNAPHFAELVLRTIEAARERDSALIGAQAAGQRQRSQGVVATTLDLALNQFIESAITGNLSRLRAENVRDGAVVVIDNRTGDVLGLVGSQNYFAPGSGMVNGATQPRSAGSTIKPVTYLLALERGSTPATILADVPTEFPTPTGPYRPENYHRHCQGPVLLREALACSLNIPAVKVLQSLGGAAPLHTRLREWGVTTLPHEPEEYGLGLTIGNAEVRLLEVTNLYATLARFGEWMPVRLLADAPPARSVPALASSRANYWLMADMLADNGARAGAFGTNSKLRFDFPVACKTGTSTDFRDNWAMAYTPEFTVGVWVGNFDGSPMREVSGVTGAAPIMHDVMVHLHRRFGTTWFPRPPEIVECEVDALTGRRLAGPRAGSIREKFAPSHLPPTDEPSDRDASGRVILGPEFAQWATSGDNYLRGRVTVTRAGLHLVSPQPGSTFLIDPDIPSSALVPLVAGGAEALAWNSPTLAVRDQGGRPVAVATEGEHQLIASDPETGKCVRTWIRVKAL